MFFICQNIKIDTKQIKKKLPNEGGNNRHISTYFDCFLRTTAKVQSQESAEARKESHKLIEQKRRQKINEKINELRELLNYPDASQNKAVVLQAAGKCVDTSLLWI
jgi:hypothetical protein